MRFGLAVDHAGFPFKDPVLRQLRALGHDVIDFGAARVEPEDDYPLRVEPLALAVARREVERGIAVCGSGVGACIAANKIPGVRASVCHDTYSARQGVEHDDMNVLVLGARVIGPELIAEILHAFAAAQFSGAERHLRRLSQIQAFERKYVGFRP